MSILLLLLLATRLSQREAPRSPLRAAGRHRTTHNTCVSSSSLSGGQTDLQLYLRRLLRDAQRKKFVSRRELCRTIAGNRCELLTVTSPAREGFAARRIVVLSARVHPGESNASWVMQGILDFLTSPSHPAAIALRAHCVFKIAPMLNPDGVINGNYRCSLAGVDLNRQWHAPIKQEHPTVYALKMLLRSLMCQARCTVMQCDAM